MKILITGSSGFIGSSLVRALNDQSIEIIGIDNHCDYYDVSLKEARLKSNQKNKSFTHYQLDISDFDAMKEIFDQHQPNIVVHLAAQVGVRYSLKNPHAYVKSNLVGFNNIIELSNNHRVKNFIYASSSSVYGQNATVPYSTSHNVDHPISLYAATKKSNELVAHTYSHLYSIPTTGLRFFTVYGPWGRPDMAPFLFLKSILEKKIININNNGNHKRAFTYIDDIIEAIKRLIEIPAQANTEWDPNSPLPNSSSSPWVIYNIGGSDPIDLMDFITMLEQKTKITANKRFLPIQPGDVLITDADCSDLEKTINFSPKTSLDRGVTNFIEWYRDYYKI